MIGTKQGNGQVGMHKESTEGKWLGMTESQAGAQALIVCLLSVFSAILSHIFELPVHLSQAVCLYEFFVSVISEEQML